MRGDAALLRMLDPRVKVRLWANADHPDDRRFLAGIFARIPEHIAPRLLAEYGARLKMQGRREANLYILDVRDTLLPELFPDTGLPFHASDDEIADAAERAVANLHARLRPEEGAQAILATLARTAKRYHVELPVCDTLRGKLARMLEAAWWRRALRKRFQIVEHAAIKAGCVHRHAAPYVTDEALRRHQRHAERTQALLERLEALNEDTGEVLILAALRASSTANPAIRRFAMLACVRGLEARADELGFVAVFLTITCPSRMHARHAERGEANKAYDGTSPRAAQAHLARRVWNAALRKLAHAGLAPGRDFFGLRTVEPHHDATPHWHVLAFVAPVGKEQFVATLRAYALADSPDEPGAAERRFIAKDIDQARGSAAGYVAKYVSKNTDGEGVGGDDEAGGTATGNAPRVVVWARLWHARQFQFFGVGAVSPFRELYRLDRIPEALETLLGDLWRAARAGDFARFIAVREARQTRLALHYEPKPSKRYPGEIARRLRGVTITGDAGPVPIVTRPYDWSIRLRDAAKQESRAAASPLPPWTRFNNSANLDRQAFFAGSGASNDVPNRGQRGVNQVRSRGARKGLRGGGESRPGPGTATRTGPSQ